MQANLDIPSRFIIHETRHWVLNHRMNSALPGYLMLSARAPVNSLAALPVEAQAELCERPEPPAIQGYSVDEAITLLRSALLDGCAPY